MKAAIYTRVSSEEQAGADKASLGQQRERCEAYCKAQGWEVAEVYEDAGVSGTKVERPALGRLLTDAGAGKFEAVVFLKTDRFGRNARDLHNLAHQLRECGVAIASATQAIDTSTPAGKAFYGFMATMAEFELDTIKERMVAGKLGAAKQGHFLSGRPAYGYDYDKVTKRLAVNQVEAAVVRRIFEMYVTEGLSYAAMARRLNAEGIPTKTQRVSAISLDGIKKGWLPNTVELLLRNRNYIGEAYYGKTAVNPKRVETEAATNGKKPPQRVKSEEGQSIRIHCPAIVSEDLWKAARRRAKQNLRRARLIPKSKDDVTVFLLSGLVRCYCDPAGRRKMHGSANIKRDGGKVKVLRYLICQRQSVYGTPCHEKRVNADKVETAVLDAIVAAYRDPQRVLDACNDYADMLQAAREAQDGIIASVKAKLGEATAEKDRLIDGWRKGLYSETDMKKHLRNVDKEMEACEDELRRLDEALRQREAAEEVEKRAWAIAGRIRDVVEEMTIPEKKELIRGLVERVTVYAEGTIKVDCRVPGLLNAAKVPQQVPC